MVGGREGVRKGQAVLPPSAAWAHGLLLPALLFRLHRMYIWEKVKHSSSCRSACATPEDRSI